MTIFGYLWQISPVVQLASRAGCVLIFLSVFSRSPRRSRYGITVVTAVGCSSQFAVRSVTSKSSRKILRKGPGRGKSGSTDMYAGALDREV